MPWSDVEVTETVADVVKVVGWRMTLAVSADLNEIITVTGDTRELVETWSEQDTLLAVNGAQMRYFTTTLVAAGVGLVRLWLGGGGDLLKAAGGGCLVRCGGGGECLFLIDGGFLDRSGGNGCLLGGGGDRLGFGLGAGVTSTVAKVTSLETGHAALKP